MLQPRAGFVIVSAQAVIAQCFDDFAVACNPPAALSNDAMQFVSQGSELGKLSFDLAQVKAGNAIGFPTVPLGVVAEIEQ